MVGIRKKISEFDGEVNQFYSEIINKTTILTIIDSILGYQSSENEVYFLKLEAIWILINLAYINEREVAIICSSST